MGEAELITERRTLLIHSAIILYGEAANDDLATKLAADIEAQWNAAEGRLYINGELHLVSFSISGLYAPGLTPTDVHSNTDPRKNYFRVETYAAGDISFVDGLGCNTGYFKLDNILGDSTTAAHEYGHTLGLDHPEHTDIRGRGTPGIMYPRGTIVDPVFQYSHTAAPFEPGGTLNPSARKVLQDDISGLRLQPDPFNRKGFAIIGAFSSVWHDKHVPVPRS